MDENLSSSGAGKAKVLKKEVEFYVCDNSDSEHSCDENPSPNQSVPENGPSLAQWNVSSHFGSCIETENDRPNRERMLSYYKITTRPKLVVITCILPIKCSLVERTSQPRAKDEYEEYRCNLFVDELFLGVNALRSNFDIEWVGWPRVKLPDESTQETIRAMLSMSSPRMNPVFMTNEEIESHMSGFCRKVVWTNFHNMPQNDAPFLNKTQLLRAYESVNRKYTNVALQCNAEIYWVIGHELMLVPQMLREQCPDTKIGFFLHIPFPVEYYFFTLPNRRQLLEGMLGADLVGFHTYDFYRSFVSCVYKIMGKTCKLRKIEMNNRSVTIDEFPMGVDYKYFTADMDSENTIVDKLRKEFDQLQQAWKVMGKSNFTSFDSVTTPTLRTGSDPAIFPIFRLIQQLESSEMDQTLILSSDRLDESSDIVLRINAYRLFLESYPEFRNKVVLLLLIQPPLFPCDTFTTLLDEINRSVTNLTGDFSTINKKPVISLYGNLSLSSMKRILLRTNVCLAVPLKSGMGLLAKEFVAARQQANDGVLILSENAGAAKELNEAILVNPYDSGAIAEAIAKALQMPVEEQRARMASMQERLCRNDVAKWANDFVNGINESFQYSTRSRTQRLAGVPYAQVVNAYRTAEKNRLMVFDYDGTLAELTDTDQPPDSQILHILNTLCADSKNTVVINSGRDKETLEKWFKQVNVDIAAEHGIWVRKKHLWQKAIDISDSWKTEVLSIVETLFENIEGIDINDTDYSIQIYVTWKGMPPFNNQSLTEQLRDRINTLRSLLTGNPDVRIIESSRKLEIKSAVVGKGRATLNWLRSSGAANCATEGTAQQSAANSEQPNGEDQYDFILAIGDDCTDEDTFRELPRNAITVKVGITPTEAKYYVMHTFDVRDFLNHLIP